MPLNSQSQSHAAKSYFPRPQQPALLKQQPTIIPQTETINEQIRQYDRNEIKVITIFDKEYPALLKEIYQPPWVLFAKGDLSLLAKETKAGSGGVTPSDTIWEECYPH